MKSKAMPSAQRPWSAQIDGSYFVNEDGTRLCRQVWRPSGPVRGVVWLAHGMGDHSARFGSLAALLTQQQFLVISHDHVGHGRSGDKPALQPHHLDIYARDVIADARLTRVDFPRPLPFFLLGMSMGGGISIEVVSKTAGTIFDGVILCAAAVIPDKASATPCKVGIAKCTVRSGCGGLMLPGLPPSTLSRHQPALDAWTADPLAYHGKISARFGVKLLAKLDEWQERCSGITIPTLVLHSRADHVCHPDSSVWIEEHQKSSDFQLKWYENGMKHDIFHEIPEDTETVERDIADWLNGHVTIAGPPLPASSAEVAATEELTEASAAVAGAEAPSTAQAATAVETAVPVPSSGDGPDHTLPQEAQAVKTSPTTAI